MTKAKKTILASILLLATSVFASATYPEDSYNYRFDQGYPVDENHMIGAYNAQGRIDVCGDWDFYATGTFLLWQPKQQGLDVALVTPRTNPTNNAAHNLNTDFDYDPGFKLTLGSFFSDDNWGLWAEYSRLHTDNSARRKADPQIDTITNYWRIGATVTNLTSIFSKWDLGLDILDLSLGRPYYIGTKLIFNPFIGGRVSWIDQKINVRTSTSTGSKYETNVSSDSWLIGPRIGINTNWLLAEGFRFFGNTSASLFYQNFKLTAKEYQDINPRVYTINASEDQSNFNANVDLSLGFGWGRYFFRQKLHFDAIAGYELMLMWNQNLMRSFIEEIKNSVHSNHGNLTPHGFIFATRLDF